MINAASVQAVAAARLHAGLARPLYESYCFARIPGTIANLLAGAGLPGLPDDVLGELPRRYQRVILLFVDAFGWRFFERFAERYPFLQRFVREGVVSKLTAQFPSTTAAHATTIHTGLPVGQSGVYEWYYYEPLVDAMITPLMFSFAGDLARDTLRTTGLAPAAFYPPRTFYQTLADLGVRSTVIQHRDYTPSTFSDVVFAGARVLPYRTLSEGLVELGAAVARESGPAYYFLYFAGVDTIGHLYGPESAHFDAECDTLLNALESVLHRKLAAAAHDTLLLITADHGQIEVAPDETIYLNRVAPNFERFLQTNRAGRPLVPAGAPRDQFLHVRAERLDEAAGVLAEQLAGRATVHRVDELIAQGFFGSGTPGETFRGRVGNLLVLPVPHETVWWYEKGRFEQLFHGHHGGLSREELEIPLLALAYP